MAFRNVGTVGGNRERVSNERNKKHKSREGVRRRG
jgi:hypothetical protein